MSWKVIPNWLKKPMVWVFTISIIFVPFFIYVSFDTYFSTSYIIDTDLAAKYGDFVGGLFGSIVGVINLILLYHIFKNQDNISKLQLKITEEQSLISKQQFNKYSEELEKIENSRKLNLNKDKLDFISNNLNTLIEKKNSFKILSHNLKEPLFYIDDENNIILASNNEIPIITYLNKCFEFFPLFIIEKKSKYEGLNKDKFDIFLEKLNITNDFFVKISNKLSEPNPEIISIERKLNNNIPFRNFNFENSSLSMLRNDINYKMSRYPYFIYPFTLTYFSNFETCLYLFNKLITLEIEDDKYENKFYFNDYKEHLLEYSKRLFIGTLSIEEIIFLINYYLYDFDKFNQLETLGLYDLLNEDKLCNHFYDYQSLKSDYIKIKEYLTNVPSPNS